MKHTKSIFATLILSILLSTPVVAKTKIIKSGNDIFHNNDISLFVNNNKINGMPMNPVFYNDYLLVPTREVFEPLGAFIVYMEEEKTVYIIYNNKIIAITANSDVAMIDNSNIKMTVQAKVVNDKLLIPLRSVSELLGLEITWDGASYTAYVNEISSNNNTYPEDNILYPEDNNSGNNTNDNSISNNSGNNTNDNSISNNSNSNTNNNQQESFSKSTITDIYFPNANQKQSILIKLSSPVSRYEESVLNDNRMILDFFDTDFNIDNSYTSTGVAKLTDLRVGIENIDGSDRTRIVLQLKCKAEEVTTTLSEDRTAVLIDFGDSILNGNINLSGIDYKNNVLSIPKKNIISMENMESFDNYNGLRYAFSFNSDLGMTDGYLKTDDNFLNGIHVENIGGKTTITVDEKRILATSITEDNTYIHVKFMLPKDKYKKIIVIDPGHGGNDPGTVNEKLLSDRILREKDIVLDVSKRLYNLLYQEGSIKPYLTRSDDTFIKLNDRAKFSNDLGDMFVSIHVNSTTVPDPNGIETYYYEKAEATEKGISSKKIAENIQRQLIKLTNARDRGIKTASFVVIKANNNPSVLVELGFISNEIEALKLDESEYKQILTDAIYLGVLESFNAYTPKR